MSEKKRGSRGGVGRRGDAVERERERGRKGRIRLVNSKPVIKRVWSS